MAPIWQTSEYCLPISPHQREEGKRKEETAGEGERVRGRGGGAEREGGGENVGEREGGKGE